MDIKSGHEYASATHCGKILLKKIHTYRWHYPAMLSRGWCILPGQVSVGIRRQMSRPCAVARSAPGRGCNLQCIFRVESMSTKWLSSVDELESTTSKQTFLSTLEVVYFPVPRKPLKMIVMLSQDYQDAMNFRWVNCNPKFNVTVTIIILSVVLFLNSSRNPVI